MRHFLCCLLLLLGLRMGGSAAETRTFPLPGGPVELTDVSGTVETYFQSMRPNAAQRQWVFDLVIRNTAVDPLRGPVVVSIEQFDHTSGPLAPDGRDTSGRAWFDLSPRIPAGGLVTGESSAARTLSLGMTEGVPTLQVKVFAATVPQGPALALVRSLDESGLPLPAVTVQETGPAGGGARQTDRRYGVATLGGAPGTYGFRFEAPGRLPVWRFETLFAGSVRILPSPRLVLRDTNSISVGPEGGIVTNRTGTLQVTVPSGAVDAAAGLTLTPLTAQTLPALLPLGWSPLQAFSLEATRPVAGPLPVRLELWDLLGTNETAALVTWNTQLLTWQTVQTIAGQNAAVVTSTVTGAGVWAVVVADVAPRVPPSAEPGQPLAGLSPLPLDVPGLSVTGRVTPESSPASPSADQVLAVGEFTLVRPSGALASGTLLRGQVAERYELRDGSVRVSPDYETFFTAFQRPRRGTTPSVQARFPLRPQWLIGSEDLVLGRVAMDLVPPTDFAGAVVTEPGGVFPLGRIRLTAPEQAVARPEALQLRTLAVSNLVSLAGDGLTLELAFEVTLGGLAPGRRLALQADGLPTNALYVVARVLGSDRYYGLEPVQRLRTDALRRLVSLEPEGDDGLPGIDGAGRFVLIRVGEAQALVKGRARAASGVEAPGLLVRRGPWITQSGEGGVFKLLAPAGTSTVSLEDPRTGSSGVGPVQVLPGQTSVDLDVALGGPGPRVLDVEPASGASQVPVVASVRLRFSQPLNPATLVGDAVRLLDPAGQPVPASVSLNLRGDAVSLLPVQPLVPESVHRLQLASTLADRAGRPMEGTREFSFTTAPAPFVRDPAAQLISYEPTNGVARIEGTPGLAESGRPVTLVNQSTGRTSTVLARADGSFSGTLEASVDDAVSVTIFNANGTSTSVPVSRQVFADGSVGLFNTGGVLQAATENGPMELQFEAGSIRSRARFKVSPVALSEVLTVVSNTPPTGGRVLGGFRLAVQATEPFTQSPEVVFPVRVEDMGLPAGVNPTNATFGLMILRQGTLGPTYELVDRLHYEDGKLVTHSPPFLGLLGSMFATTALLATELFVIPCLMTWGGSLVVTGSVMAAQVDTGGNPLDGTIQYLPGAAIVVRSPSSALPGLPGRLIPGSVFAASNGEGKFTALAPVNPSDPGRAVALRATHPRFPGQLADRPIPELSANERVLLQNIVTRFHLIFVQRPYERRGLPAVVFSHGPEFPPAPGTNQVTVLTTDNDSRPTLELSVYDVFPIRAGVTVMASDVDLVPGEPEDAGENGVRQVFRLSARKPLGAILKGYAVDSDGNETVEFHRVLFGAVEPPLENEIPASDPNDRFGPTVVSTSPVRGSRSLVPGQPITVRFSEPVDRAVLDDPFAVTLFPPAGEVALALSADQLELTLTFAALRPGTAYTLGLGTGIRDLSGNRFDQDPRTTVADSFELRFETAPVPITDFPGVMEGGGVVTHGSYAFVLDRRPGLRSQLVIFDISNPRAPATVGRLQLPGFARDLTLLPGWSFKRRAEGPAETRDLLAVVGGDVGQGSLQYLRVYDVTDPRQVPDPAAPGAARAEAMVVGRVISVDPATAVTKVVWSAPTLGYLRMGFPDTVNTVDLQTLILAENLTPAEFAQLPADGVPGVDANGDGDYVDAGDQLPVPERFPLEFTGKTGTFALPDTDQGMGDFSMVSGGRLIGVTLDAGKLLGTNGLPSTNAVLPAYRTLMADGLVLPRELASVEFTNGLPRRVTLIPRVPLVETNQIVLRDLALVSVRHPGTPAGSNSLVVVDLTDRLAPRRLAEIPLPADRDGDGQAVAGGVFSARLRADGRLMVSTERDILLLDLARLTDPRVNGNGLHPAIVGRLVQAGGTARAFDAVPGLAQVVASGSRSAVVQTPPELRVVSFARPPFRPETLVNADRSVVAELFSSLTEETQLRLARVNAAGSEVVSSLEPPSDRVHYYVDVFAPGAAGAVIELSLESLNRAGYPLRPRGALFPPVRSVSDAALAQLRQPIRDCDPPTRTCRAYRLSSDPTSPYYNRYLSEPFTLVFEELNPARLAELRQTLERHVLWSGQYLRIGFDLNQRSNPVLGEFASTLNPTEGVLVPGVSLVVRSLPADYLMGPNPGPVIGGVNVAASLGSLGAHNGEVRLMPVDMALPGRRLPLEFRRASASQGLYDGPFGRGWDFNFNQRVVLARPELLPAGGTIPLVDRGDAGMNEVARPGDLLWFNGAGRTLVYADVGTNAPAEIRDDPLVGQLGWLNKVHTYYRSPRGVFHFFVRMKDGRFARLDPDGKQTWFGPDGRLERLYDKYELNGLQCTYNERGELTAILDEQQRPLEIGYYRAPSDPDFRDGVDESTTAPETVGRIARLRDFTGRDVRYYYDDAGNLERFEGPEVRTVAEGGFRGRQVIRYLQTDCSRPDRSAGSVVGMQSGDAAGTPLLGATDLGGAGRDSVSAVQLAGRTVQLGLSFTNTAAALASGQGRAEVTAGDGSRTEYGFDAFGRPLSVKLSGTNQPVEETVFEYTPEGLTRKITYPEGNTEEFFYDTTHPSLRSRGNLLRLVKSPGPRGGPVLEARSTYDARYNQPLTKTDYNGHTAFFTLDGRGRDAERITLDGETETYRRDAFGVLEEHTTADGIVTRFQYNDEGSLVEQRTGDLVVRYEYEGIPGRLGLRSAMIDGRGIRTRYVYDERNRPVRTEREGQVIERAYDERGFEIQTRTTADTGLLKVEERVYDALGFVRTNIVHDVEVFGAVTNLVTVFEPDEASRVKRARFPSGEEHEFTYDHAGRMTVHRVGEFVRSYTYDLNGNVITNRIGDAFEVTTYDGLDRPVRVLTPVGGQLVRTFDGNNNLRTLTVTDPDDGVIFDGVYEVDARNRYTSITRRGDRGDSTAQYRFETAARKQIMVGADGSMSETEYDASGRLSRVVTPTRRLEMAYDLNGNLTNKVSVEGQFVFRESAEFNNRDQRVASIDTLGQVSRMEPGLDGRVLRLTDRSGNTTTNTYTVLGELASTLRPDGRALSYLHDPNREIAGVLYDEDQGVRHAYDESGRWVATTNVDLTVSTLGNFDARNAPRTHRYPGDVVVESTHDAEGRLRTRQFRSPRGEREEAYQYDVLGRLRKVSDPSGSIEYRYDKLGYAKEILSTQLGEVRRLEQTATVAGFRDTVTYPSGITIQSGRDATGRLKRLAPDDAAGVVLADQVYVADDLVGRRVLGSNVIAATFSYDPLRRTVARRYERAGDGRRLVDVRYAYESSGAQVARQFLHRGGRADFFGFDAAYKLRRADLDVRPSVAGELARELDGFGIPAGVTGSWKAGRTARRFEFNDREVLTGTALLNPDALPAGPFAERYEAPDATLFIPVIDGLERGRDAAGNVTNAVLWVRLPGDVEPTPVVGRMEYNDLGQLIRVDRADGVAVLNAYGPSGLRIRRTVTGPVDRCVPGDVEFVYDGANLIEMRDIAAASAARARFFYGDDADDLMAGDLWDEASGQWKRHYFLSDAQRTVLAVTDAQGEVVERYRHEAWGWTHLEAPDTAAPAVSRVIRDGNELLIEFTEPVLPALANDGGGTNLVAELLAIGSRLRLRAGDAEVPGLLRYAETVPGREFGTVFRFVPSGILPGAVTLELEAGAVLDEWSLPNAAESRALNLGAGPVVYSGPAPGSTAGVVRGRSVLRSPFGFHGHVFDEDTGLLYCRARFYDPTTGLFLQRDPAGFEDSVNLYAGFANNPVNFRDPTGASVAKYALADYGARLSEIGGQASLPRDGMLAYLFGKTLQFAGAVLQLGTSTAEGLDRLDHLREGTLGLVDLAQAGSLIASDAAIVASAGGTMFGGFRYGVPRVADALPRYGRLARAYSISGFDSVRDLVSQKLGLRTAAQVATDAGFAGREITAIHRNLLFHRATGAEAMVRIRMGYKSELWRKMRRFHVDRGIEQKTFAHKKKTGGTALTYEGGTVQVADLDSSVVYINGRVSDLAEDNAFLMKGREFYERDFRRAHGPNSRPNVPFQHNSQMQAITQVGSADQLGGVVVADHALEFSELETKIGHQGHTMTFRLDSSGNLLVYRTPGWMDDIDAIRTDFRGQSRLAELGGVTQFWALPPSWHSWNAKYER